MVLNWESSNTKSSYPNTPIVKFYLLPGENRRSEGKRQTKSDAYGSLLGDTGGGW